MTAYSVLYSPSLALVLVVIAVVLDVFLAVVVLESSSRSATNRIFALLTVCTVCWLTTNYLSSSLYELPALVPYALMLNRLGIFFAAPMSLSFFLLGHTMPAPVLRLSHSTFYSVIIATFVMMILNISPYAFTGTVVTSGVSSPTAGPGLLPFSVLSTLFSGLAVFFLVRTYRRSAGVEREQARLVLLGILAMLGLIIATILFPILLLHSLVFLPFTPLYALVFLGMTAYAITKYQLFNIKVLFAQALTIAICLVLFGKMFGESATSAEVLDGLVLGAVIIFGFFLVRSVRREVDQREHIELLAKELQETNARQETLIHFIGHEVKGFLTKAEGAFAALVEGDFGELPPALVPFVREALSQTRDGVTSVSDILKASNQKKGTVTYKQEPFDLKRLVIESVGKARAAAEAKKLSLTLRVNEQAAFPFSGDKEQLEEHVLRNLIDNAIAYTPTGAVDVTLEQKEGRYVLSVKDSGVGITEEDKRHLFTEGGHGKESQKVNAHSTGYGLFIAKNVVTAEGGTIRAESEGPGKGSTFVVELPAPTPH